MHRGCGFPKAGQPRPPPLGQRVWGSPGRVWGPGSHGGVAALGEDTQCEVGLVAGAGGAGHHEVVAGAQAAAAAHVATGAEARAVRAQQAPQVRATVRGVPEAQQLGEGRARRDHDRPSSPHPAFRTMHPSRPPLQTHWITHHAKRAPGHPCPTAGCQRAGSRIESGIWGPVRRPTCSGICKKEEQGEWGEEPSEPQGSFPASPHTPPSLFF